jgi:hypothetical protein
MTVSLCHTPGLLVGLLVATSFSSAPLLKPPPCPPGHAAESAAPLLRARRSDSPGVAASPTDGGARRLTLDPRLRQSTGRSCAPSRSVQRRGGRLRPDGRVLALVGQSADRASGRPSWRCAWAPTASVFKVISATALVERRSGAPHLLPAACHRSSGQPRRPAAIDRRCETLAFGLGKSRTRSSPSWRRGA